VSPKTCTIEFRYDDVNDIVFAHPYWNIESESDCLRWYQQCGTYFTELGSTLVDVVFELEDFSVDPTILPVWDQYRARVIKEFTRHSVRVKTTRRVSTVAHTSSALYNADSDEAADIDTAVASILEARRQPRSGQSVRVRL